MHFSFCHWGHLMRLNGAERLTTGRDADRLLHPLVSDGRQVDGHHHDAALRGSHQQTGADHAVRLPGKTLTEVKGGDGLSRLSFYAGDT